MSDYYESPPSDDECPRPGNEEGNDKEKSSDPNEQLSEQLSFMTVTLGAIALLQTIALDKNFNSTSLALNAATYAVTGVAYYLHKHTKNIH